MIRRLVERWLGYDRLLVAYEKVKRDNEKLKRKYDQLARQHRILTETHSNTAARAERHRAEIAKLHRLYVRALVELEWERFLATASQPTDPEVCEKIRLMDHDQAWDVADLLAERFRKPMYAHYCTLCPVNPITRECWWHVTSKKNRRRQVSQTVR